MSFLWTSAAQEAFDAIKQLLTQAPVLASPNFAKELVLETDVCNVGIGAVLMQDGHPIAYLSQGLNATNLARSTYEKKSLAILLAVDKRRPYLKHQ